MDGVLESIGIDLLTATFLLAVMFWSQADGDSKADYAMIGLVVVKACHDIGASCMFSVPHMDNPNALQAPLLGSWVLPW